VRPSSSAVAELEADALADHAALLRCLIFDGDGRRLIGIEVGPCRRLPSSTFPD